MLGIRPRRPRSSFSLTKIVALGVIAVNIVACGASSNPSAPAAPARPGANDVRQGGVVRVALWQEPALLNPLLGTQTVNELVSRTMMEGLLAYTPEGKAVGGLASEVPTLDNGGVSQNGQVIMWKLRKGVLWADGQPFTSKDVRFTYDVIMNPLNPVTTQAGYPDIEAVETPDDATVVVRYRNIYAGFKQHFQWVLPEHVFGGETAIESHAFNQSPIGTGPFRFKSWDPGSAIVTERNPNYRESGKPHVDGIMFRLVPAKDIGILWLKTNEAEVLWNLAEDNFAEIDGIPDTTMNPAPSNQIERLILNTSCSSGPQQGDPSCKHPVLGDVRVRQAIELALDRKSLVDELLAGRTKIASSIIPFGPYAVQLPLVERNPSEARRLLEEAGWASGPDGIRVKEGERASVGFLTTSGDRLREQSQALIKGQLQEVGIEFRIETVPSAILFGSWADGAVRSRGNFDVVMHTINTPIDPQADLFNLFHSSRVPSDRVRAGQNYQRILDPELDAALAAASSTVDESKRAAAYRTVAERVAADKGHILLYSRLELDAFNKRVKGHTPNIWSNFTWNAEDWSL